MNLKITGYKFLFVGIVSFFYLIALIMGILFVIDGETMNTGIEILLIGSVIYSVILIIPDKVFMSWVFMSYNEDNFPDYFMIYAAKLVSLDNHFSKKERRRVRKHIDKEYRIEFSMLKMNNFALLITEIEEYFNKYKRVYPNFTRLDRLRLLNQLVGIAVVDRFLSDTEINFLNKTAERLSISKKDLEFILNRYQYVTQEETEYQRTLRTKPTYSLQKAFSILGIESDCDLEEVKSAYRELAKIYHPDKQRGSKKGKDIAKAQFQVISSAYELIKAKKG